MFEVVEIVPADIGCDYYIKNTKTGETKVLHDCGCFDMDLFDEYDFETECEAV